MLCYVMLCLTVLWGLEYTHIQMCNVMRRITHNKRKNASGLYGTYAQIRLMVMLMVMVIMRSVTHSMNKICK